MIFWHENVSGLVKKLRIENKKINEKSTTFLYLILDMDIFAGIILFINLNRNTFMM